MKQTVLEFLFSAKRILEDSKDKKDKHSLGYINEAIKWQQDKK